MKDRRFIEFVNNNNERMLIDFDDIRVIQEGNTDSSKGYCKIFFFSDVNVQQWIKEDYNSVINKMKMILKITTE
jgi:hypothetical protein